MRSALSLALVLFASACAASAPSVVAPAAPPPKVAASAPAAPAATPPPSVEAQLIDLSAHGPDATTYPEADAVVLLSRTDVTLGADGSVTEKHHTIVRILEAQRGKEKFADVHVPYDSERQSLTIDTARTVNKDGVHVASAEEISDIVPAMLREASVYSGMRERVISFPAVDKGSVLELVTTLTTRATADSALGGEILLADWDPVLDSVASVTVPEGVVPHLQVENATLAPVETHDKAAATHTFTFALTNQPDRQYEPWSLAEASILPRLVYSFQPDWNVVMTKIAERYLSVVRPATLDAQLVETAKRLVGKARTDEERAAAILRFVAQDVRSVRLPLGWAGYAPRAPEQVLKNLYGDDRDKVGLFVALCSAVGLDAQPAFVRGRAVPVVEAVPTLAQFDRLIARVTLAGAPVWVDPSETYAQLGSAAAGVGQSALVLVPGKSALERRPMVAPEASSARVTSQVVLDENGTLTVTYRYSFTGVLAAELERALRVLKGELVDKYFQTAALSVTSAAVDVSHKTSNLGSVSGPVEVTHVVRVPAYAPAQGDLRVVELPPPSLENAAQLPSPGTAGRRSGMYLGTPRSFVADTTLALPAGWKVAAFPPALDGGSAGIHYKSSCTLEGRSLHCHQEVQLTALQITAEDYTGYHAALVRLDDYQHRAVLLAR
jgi:transglutaminase-like putative cysteine protease